MAEIGKVAHATVVRVMDYGAIVRLEDGTVGLVHISELDHCFVENVRAYCNEGASIEVRVLRCKKDGRWEFSMKQVSQYQPPSEAPQRENFGADQPMYDSAMPNQSVSHPPRGDSGSDARGHARSASREAFNEKLRDFLSDSSERIEDVRRHHDHRLNGKRR